MFTLCEQKSKPFPKILTEKKILNQVKSGLPEGSSINEFDDVEYFKFKSCIYGGDGI